MLLLLLSLLSFRWDFDCSVDSSVGGAGFFFGGVDVEDTWIHNFLMAHAFFLAYYSIYPVFCTNVHSSLRLVAHLHHVDFYAIVRSSVTSRLNVGGG